MRSPVWFGLALCLLPALLHGQDSVPVLMGKAQKAYLNADYPSAKELFTEVLMQDPHNALAIQYLRNLKAREAAHPAPPKSHLDSLVLDGVNFKAATFASALDSLRVQAARLGETVSFVSQLPADQMQTPITLSLARIPFPQALTYLCSLNHATYRVDPYAIVILPAGAEPAPASPAQ